MGPMDPILDKLRDLVPNSRDDAETRHFKILVYLSVGIIALMIIAAVATFLLTIDGAEQTMVPDLRGMDLASAAVSLQDRGLYPRVQLRYSANPTDKGNVLAQEPPAGTVVKSGRQVTLQVSKGAIIDKVENYVGWKLTDLELHLQTLSTTYGPLLQLEKPVTSVFASAPAGTIIQQKPAPDTPLTGLTTLQVVVSLGTQSENIKIADFKGVDFKSAMNLLAQLNVPFVFTDRPASGSEPPGEVVSQSPDPGSDVPKGTVVNLVMTDPQDVPDGYLFGMLQKTLPDYPVPVDLTVQAISPDAEKTTLLSTQSSGGLLTVPYVVKESSVIVVSIFSKELFRLTVGAPGGDADSTD